MPIDYRVVIKSYRICKRRQLEESISSLETGGGQEAERMEPWRSFRLEEEVLNRWVVSDPNLETQLEPWGHGRERIAAVLSTTGVSECGSD